MQVIAEREYGFVHTVSGQSERVILRIGAPQEKDPSTWVLPFKIVGPGQQRLERAFAAVDAVQALQWGLQMIQVELRAIENISGGKLFFLDQEDLGFTPLNIP